MLCSGAAVRERERGIFADCGHSDSCIQSCSSSKISSELSPSYEFPIHYSRRKSTAADLNRFWAHGNRTKMTVVRANITFVGCSALAMNVASGNAAGLRKALTHVCESIPVLQVPGVEPSPLIEEPGTRSTGNGKRLKFRQGIYFGVAHVGHGFKFQSSSLFKAQNY